MKYVIIAVLGLLCLLSPYFCGRKSMSLYMERYRNTCSEFGLNDRPFESSVGYLRSSFYLNEPFSTTISSLGLRPEVVDVFRDIVLSISGEIVHGPKHLMWGAGHAVFSLSGKDWKISGEEWTTNRIFGMSERYLKLEDAAQESEGSLFIFQNCGLREEGSGKEKKRIFSADNFALWPGVAAGGFRSEYSATEKGFENQTKASLLKFSEGRVSNLDLRVSSELLEKGKVSYELSLKALELSLEEEDLGAAELSLNYSGRSLAFLKESLARGTHKDIFEALETEDPRRFLQSSPQAELSLKTGGEKPFAANVKISLKDGEVSSWSDLIDLISLEAELEGNIPKELALLGLEPGAKPLKITYDAGQLFINGEEK